MFITRLYEYTFSMNFSIFFNNKLQSLWWSALTFVYWARVWKNGGFNPWSCQTRLILVFAASWLRPCIILRRKNKDGLV